MQIKAVANLVDEHRAQLLNYLTRTSRNQKKKIKSARKVAETQRIRKGFSSRSLCAFASLREIFVFWDLNFHFLPKNGRKLLVSC